MKPPVQGELGATMQVLPTVLEVGLVWPHALRARLLRVVIGLPIAGFRDI
jgi:hypothetical protein